MHGAMPPATTYIFKSQGVAGMSALPSPVHEYGSAVVAAIEAIEATRLPASTAGPGTRRPRVGARSSVMQVWHACRQKGPEGSSSGAAASTGRNGGAAASKGVSGACLCKGQCMPACPCKAEGQRRTANCHSGRCCANLAGQPGPSSAGASSSDTGGECGECDEDEGEEGVARLAAHDAQARRDARRHGHLVPPTGWLQGTVLEELDNLWRRQTRTKSATLWCTTRTTTRRWHTHWTRTTTKVRMLVRGRLWLLVRRQVLSRARREGGRERHLAMQAARPWLRASCAGLEGALARRSARLSALQSAGRAPCRARVENDHLGGGVVCAWCGFVGSDHVSIPTLWYICELLILVGGGLAHVKRVCTTCTWVNAKVSPVLVPDLSGK